MRPRCTKNIGSLSLQRQRPNFHSILIQSSLPFLTLSDRALNSRFLRCCTFATAKQLTALYELNTHRIDQFGYQIMFISLLFNSQLWTIHWFCLILEGVSKKRRPSEVAALQITRCPRIFGPPKFWPYRAKFPRKFGLPGDEIS